MPDPPETYISKKTILDWFRAGEFEMAFNAIDRSGTPLPGADIEPLLADLETALDTAAASGDGQAARKIQNQISALTRWRENGFNRRAVLPVVSISPGYRGKILLVAMSGGLLDDLVFVRSNDLYHRDILANTQMEISDLGLRSTTVHPLGGAYLRDGSADGRVAIWGGSDEFGACDKNFLAELLIPFYPGRTVVIED